MCITWTLLSLKFPLPRLLFFSTFHYTNLYPQTVTDRDRKLGSHSPRGPKSSASMSKTMAHSRGPGQGHCSSHGLEEKGGEGKEQLEVDVESLHINPRRRESRSSSHSHSRSHSPAADPIREYDSHCPSETRGESESNDSTDGNDMPWDHSLVIAEPDVQVLICDRPHTNLLRCGFPG